MKKRLFAIVLLGILFLTGCDKTEVAPEVNDKNCTKEIFATIKNDEVRRDFASRCATRNKFRPSPKDHW